MINPYILVLILAYISIVETLEFSLKGDPCSKFDSCRAKPASRTCSCDNDCNLYGTCCQNVKKLHEDVPEDTYHCYNRRTVNPVFVKRSCSKDFRGHDGIKWACFDDDEDEMDVQNNILVTSHKTKITYWNRDCARCNGEASEDLEIWNIKVYCPPHKDVDRSLIRRNLTFDHDKKLWVLKIDGELLNCHVKYAPPPYIDEVKRCVPNLISACPENYINKDIATNCPKYHAERKLKNSDIYYKNIQCAICNGVNVRDLECAGMVPVDHDVDETDFREMVTEVFRKGDWLYKEPGKRFECSKGYSYDPARMRCRRDNSLIHHEFFSMSAIPNSSRSFRNAPLAAFIMLIVLLF